LKLSGHCTKDYIFEGNKYEGETMLPIIDAFKERYGFEQLTIVADAGLINHQNIEELSQRSYPYILGARIKNESGTIKKNILSLSLKDGQYKMIKKDDNTTLIISYSKARARKDRHNRERGLKKLEKQLSSGKLTKANINNRGYNKYLKLEGEVKIEIDKGYIYNYVIDLQIDVLY
jgi:transposase